MLLLLLAKVLLALQGGDLREALALELRLLVGASPRAAQQREPGDDREDEALQLAPPHVHLGHDRGRLGQHLAPQRSVLRLEPRVRQEGLG